MFKIQPTEFYSSTTGLHEYFYSEECVYINEYIVNTDVKK